MSDPEQIERDLREYLDKEPNLSRNDRMAFLRTIFHKHLEVNRLEHVIPYKDFFLMAADAKRHYIGMKVPLKISKHEVDQNDLTHIAFLESFTLYLNRMNLLRKSIKFDYTE